MQTINLTQNNFKMPPVVYMVQNDTGRELKMILDDVTLDGTETGAVAIKRSNGSYYTIAATIDATNNAFDADMTQALTQPSRTECQLKVTASDDTVISTYTFIIMVQPSTDGINEAQLGYSVQQLRQDAEDIRTGGLPADVRLALLQIAQKVAYIDENGQQYYQDLYDALAPSALLTGITAVYTQSGTVYDTDTLDSLKANLVVTATYSDSSTETLPASAYTLSGTLEEGTSTITVSYEGKTDDFNVTVSVRTIRVFKGKGVSGTSIIDNANRALSEPFAYENVAPISVRWPDYSNTKVGFKNTTTNVNTIDTAGPIFGTESDIGASSLPNNDAWVATTEERVLLFKQNGVYQYHTYSETSGYARLLFANASDASTAISETISGTIYIKGVPYHLVEANISDFE